jgi:hypothetical protein
VHQHIADENGKHRGRKAGALTKKYSNSTTVASSTPVSTQEVRCHEVVVPAPSLSAVSQINMDARRDAHTGDERCRPAHEPDECGHRVECE